MPSVEFGTSSYERGRGDMPDLPVINMFAEEAPTEERGLVLQSRFGLEDRGADMGAGPIVALFQRDNVLSTALFGLSDRSLYRGTTLVGVIDGEGPASIAGYEDFIFVTRGAGLWGYNGTTLAEITLPDDFSALKVIVAGSRVVVIRTDTGKFYWSDPLEDDIEALDFATAENQPDRALDLLFIDGVLRIFGAETVELWPLTTDSDLPFQPLQASVIERGIRATGCAVAIGPTFAWVTNLNEVCLGSEDNIISTPGLQKKVADSLDVSLFAFTIDGVEFLALRLDAETHAWSARSQRWSRLTSYGEDNWIPRCHANGVFGSAVDGRTIEFSGEYQDFGGVLERRFRAGFAINSGGVTINKVGLRTNPGQTPDLTGDYAVPVVEMTLSRDGGQTWENPRSASLGAQGRYRERVEWHGCGQAAYPAFMADFRVTDPVPFRVSNVLVNEPSGGR